MTKDNLTIACVQMQSGIKAEENIATACEYIKQAATEGADFVSLPEMVNLMQIDKSKTTGEVFPQAQDKGLLKLCGTAKENKIWLHIGSMMFCNDGDKDFVNRGFLINDEGEIIAQYDKLHMFDVNLPNKESYKESASFQAGSNAVVATTPWGVCGLSICYDLRFAYLYRTLSQAGARLIFVPAAFTATTGAKHWHKLLQARAIECGAWIVAANQGATHADGRKTYGHSLIVNPDGDIILDAKEKTGVHIAKIDLTLSDIARQQIPSLQHDNFPKEVITS